MEQKYGLKEIDKTKSSITMNSKNDNYQKRKNAENKNQEKNLKNFHVKRHITFKGVNTEINLNES